MLLPHDAIVRQRGDLDLALRKAAPEQPKSEQKIEKKWIELLEKAGISSEKEQKVVDAMEPVFQAGALINPVIGIPLAAARLYRVASNQENGRR